MDMQIWAIFFAGIVGMQEHPGNKKPKSIEECGRIADVMYMEYLHRAESLKCRG